MNSVKASPGPALEAVRLAHERRRAEAAIVRVDFLTRYRLSVFRTTHPTWRRHAMAVLGSGGAGRKAVEAFIREFFGPWGVSDNPGFDHPYILGRGRRATLLLGHPYPINLRGESGGRVQETLAAAGDLGVPTHIGPASESLYGHGTILVRIGAMPAPALEAHPFLTVTELMQALAARDVELTHKDGVLTISGPVGVVRRPLLNTLRRLKPEILAMLEGGHEAARAAGGPLEAC